MQITSLQTQDFTRKQQEFLQQYQVFSFINGEISADYELWELVHSASEHFFSFDEWEEFYSNHGLA